MKSEHILALARSEVALWREARAIRGWGALTRGRPGYGHVRARFHRAARRHGRDLCRPVMEEPEAPPEPVVPLAYVGGKLVVITW